MSLTYYDNTMLSAYKACPRSYFLRHCMEWRSQGTSMPLIFGLAWHAGMDSLWTAAADRDLDISDLAEAGITGFKTQWSASEMPVELSLEETQKWEPRTPSIAHEMYYGYATARRSMLELAALIAPEQPFAVPMPGLTDTWYVGRLDKVIEYNGETVVLEHKTTTEYKVDGGFKTSYIESWYSDSQVKGYLFGGSLYYPNLTGVWVDAALVHKKVHDKFRLIPVQHQAPIMFEWLEHTKTWITRLQQDTALWQASPGKLPGECFPKNEGQCMGKYGSCPFLDICRTIPNPEQLSEPPAGYVREKWEPFDILKLAQIINPTE